MKVVVVFFAVVCACTALTRRVPLTTDIPLDMNVKSKPWLQGGRLVVKFVDSLRVREASLPEEFLTWIKATKGSPSVSVQLKPTFAVPHAEVEKMLARAAKNTGREQPDLLGIFNLAEVMVARPGRMTDHDVLALEDLASLGRALQQAALSCVEYVEWNDLGVPPPVHTDTQVSDPDTPLFVDMQHYRRASTGGISADWANNNGANGRGVRLADCEYAWTFDHEDVFPLVEEEGWTQNGAWEDHGTASAGIAVGQWNAWGIDGVAREADFYTFSEWTQEGGLDRPRSVLAACSSSAPGDIVLLEMQTSCCGVSDYVPAETSQTVWTIVKAATDAGVVVVAAAGNGNANLDHSRYSEYNGRGDSGSIIVGAGSASTLHTRLSFSSYGARVDVQAWGEDVTTGGYGNLFGGSDTSRHYTATFGGTSSASAITAAAVASIQGYIADSGNARLTSEEMRALLERTGRPQGNPGTGHIGPAINMESAIQGLPTFLSARNTTLRT